MLIMAITTFCLRGAIRVIIKKSLVSETYLKIFRTGELENSIPNTLIM